MTSEVKSLQLQKQVEELKRKLRDANHEKIQALTRCNEDWESKFSSQTGVALKRLEVEHQKELEQLRAELGVQMGRSLAEVTGEKDTEIKKIRETLGQAKESAVKQAIFLTEDKYTEMIKQKEEEWRSKERSLTREIFHLSGERQQINNQLAVLRESDNEKVAVIRRLNFDHCQTVKEMIDVSKQDQSKEYSRYKAIERSAQEREYEVKRLEGKIDMLRVDKELLEKQLITLKKYYSPDSSPTISRVMRFTEREREQTKKIRELEDKLRSSQREKGGSVTPLGKMSPSHQGTDSPVSSCSPDSGENIAALKRQRKELRDRVKKLEDKCTSLELRIAESDTKLEEDYLQREFTLKQKFNSEIEQLENESASFREKIHNLSNVTKSNSEVEEMELALERCEKRYQRLYTEHLMGQQIVSLWLEDTEGAVELVRQELDRKIQELDETHNLNESFRIRVQSLKDEYSSVQLQNEKVIEERDIAVNCRANLEEDLKRALETVDTYKHRLSYKEEERETLAKANELLKCQQEGTSLLMDKQIQEIDSLKTKESEFKSQRKDHDSLKEKLLQSQSKERELMAIIQTLEDRNSVLQNELQLKEEKAARKPYREDKNFGRTEVLFYPQSSKFNNNNNNNSGDESDSGSAEKRDSDGNPSQEIEPIPHREETNYDSDKDKYESDSDIAPSSADQLSNSSSSSHTQELSPDSVQLEGDSPMGISRSPFEPAHSPIEISHIHVETAQSPVGTYQGTLETADSLLDTSNSPIEKYPGLFGTDISSIETVNSEVERSHSLVVTDHSSIETYNSPTPTGIDPPRSHFETVHFPIETSPNPMLLSHTPVEIPSDIPKSPSQDPLVSEDDDNNSVGEWSHTSEENLGTTPKSPNLSPIPTPKSTPMKPKPDVFLIRYNYNPLLSSPNPHPEQELPLRAGDCVYIYGKPDLDGFYIGELPGGKRGLVPSNFVEKIELSSSPSRIKPEKISPSDKGVSLEAAKGPLDLYLQAQSGAEANPHNYNSNLSNIIEEDESLLDESNLTKISGNISSTESIKLQISNESLDKISELQNTPPSPRRIPTPRDIRVNYTENDVDIHWAPPSTHSTHDIIGYNVNIGDDGARLIEGRDKNSILLSSLNSELSAGVHTCTLSTVTHMGTSECIEFFVDRIPVPSPCDLYLTEDVNGVKISWDTPDTKSLSSPLIFFNVHLNGKIVNTVDYSEFILNRGVVIYEADLLKIQESSSDTNIFVSVNSVLSDGRHSNLSEGLEIPSRLLSSEDTPIRMISVESDSTEEGFRHSSSSESEVLEVFRKSSLETDQLLNQIRSTAQHEEVASKPPIDRRTITPSLGSIQRQSFTPNEDDLFTELEAQGASNIGPSPMFSIDNPDSPSESEDEIDHYTEITTLDITVTYYVALYDYNPKGQPTEATSDYQPELKLQKGDVVAVYGEMDSGGFFQAQVDTDVGIVPYNLVEKINISDISGETSSALLFQATKQAFPAQKFTALYSYNPRMDSPNSEDMDDELSFESGASISIYGDVQDDGFYIGEQNGEMGFVPSNFVESNELLKAPESPQPVDTSKGSKGASPLETHKTNKTILAKTKGIFKSLAKKS